MKLMLVSAYMESGRALAVYDARLTALKDNKPLVAIGFVQAGEGIDREALGMYSHAIKSCHTVRIGLVALHYVGIANPLVHLDAREEEVDFTDPYAVAQLAILANSNSGVESIDDLNQPGRIVAVKTGSTGDIYATKNLANAEIVRLADESACVTESYRVGSRIARYRFSQGASTAPAP